MALSSDVAGSALAAPDVDARPRAWDPTGLCNNGFCKEKKEHEKKKEGKKGEKEQECEDLNVLSWEEHVRTPRNDAC